MKERLERAWSRVTRRRPRRGGAAAIDSSPTPESQPKRVVTTNSANVPPAIEPNASHPNEQASSDANAIVTAGELATGSSDTVSSDSDDIVDDDTSLEEHGSSKSGASSKAHAIASDGSFTKTHDHASADADNKYARAATKFDLRCKAYDTACGFFQGQEETLLKKDDAESLIKKIDSVYEEARKVKLILRGIEKLQKAQGGIEALAFVVDVVKAISSIHPAASGAMSIVEGVTKIMLAISKSGSKLAEKQVKMLRELQYVYQCEHLSDGRGGDTIFETLVQVYRSLLEYYIEANGMFKKNDVMLAVNLCGENKTLSEKVDSFLENIASLERNVSLYTATQTKTLLYRDVDKKITKLLGAEALSAQSRYHAKLQTVREKPACASIIDAENVRRRLFENGGKKLIITGNIGCGKSVIMSFIRDYLVDEIRLQPIAPIICCHYCRHDDSGHILGIIRGLIYAILGQDPETKVDFEKWHEQRKRLDLIEPSESPKELESFLLRTAGKLNRPILLAIDGLDECNVGSRKSLLTLLEELSNKSHHVKYLLTCRPYDDILTDLKEDERIHLQPDLSRDQLIIDKEINKKLGGYSDEMKAMIWGKLSAHAQGNAIWIRTVVSAISSSKITLKEKMEQFLGDMPLPEKLSETYQKLFHHCTEGCGSNLDLAWSALKILASARRDLTVRELAWATSIANAEPSATEIAAVKVEADCGRLLRLIRPFITELGSSDAGLAAKTVSAGAGSTYKKSTDVKSEDAKYKERLNTKIRLVHQSAKEFVIAYGTASGRDISSDRVPNLASHYAKFLPEQFMMNICIRYLLLKEIGDNCLFSEGEKDLMKLSQKDIAPRTPTVTGTLDLDRLLTLYGRGNVGYSPKSSNFGGFFVYASCYWAKHMASAGQLAVSALDDLEELCRHNSRRLDNWMQQLCRPKCTLQPKCKLTSKDFDPLVVAAFFMPESDEVLDQVLQQGRFNGDCYGKASLVMATEVLLQYNKLPRLERLLTMYSSKNDLQMLQCFSLILQRWGVGKKLLRNKWVRKKRVREGENRNDWDGLFGVVEKKVDDMVSGHWANDLFCLAAEKGCMPIVKTLVQAAESNSKLKAAIWGIKRNEEFARKQRDHQSIGCAAAAGELAMVKYLLQHEDANTHLFHVNARGQTVLHMAAAYRCSTSILHALAPRVGVFIPWVDDDGKTPADAVLGTSFNDQKKSEALRILSRAAKTVRVAQRFLSNTRSVREARQREEEARQREEEARQREEEAKEREEEAQRVAAEVRRVRTAAAGVVTLCALALTLAYGGFQFVLGVLLGWMTSRSLGVLLHMP